ncbi:putative heme/steroid binding domain protein [Aspergillus clavatus NRRL 1]|uniref:Heme/steroid binding domain protein, putative n=1 Tax=Aspergillus clavatus (strain ATCC 1007 / CBS 513.65 / DSM 816 / NCTC 3887 / NRRL 1 / QM 1276 / 107) TaxID=344612 RepID=A1CNI2_ASPCL|nr:heme/steroid binding domain protein, putative [Aspergillus clavatus NRRL 1]EAW07203.1 heme/steroid binding domain protein, putative [Aspergillus clavatus NRRL 1]
MSELRQRQVPPTSSSPSSKPPKSKAPRRSSHARSSIGILDIIRVLVTLVVASCGLSYYMTGESVLWGYRPWFTRWPLLVRYIQGPLALTPAQLALYNGTDASLPIYLAVNGTIFDVSANPHVYGPGGGYSFFAGRDATRAFVTGCFQEDLTHDLTGVEEMYIPLESEEDRALGSGERKNRRAQDVRDAWAKVHRQVAHWENFFRNHKKYFEVGRVVGLEELPTEKRELCRAAAQQRPKKRQGK